MINISCFISRKYCVNYIRVIDNHWQGVFLIIVYNAVRALWCGVYLYQVQVNFIYGCKTEMSLFADVVLNWSYLGNNTTDGNTYVYN